MSACFCTVGRRNTGIPVGAAFMKTIRRIHFVDLVAADGTRNGIDVSSPFTETDFKALVNNTDGTKRWFPSPRLENVVSVREATVYKTYNSGSKKEIRQGVRPLVGIIPQADHYYLKKLEPRKCLTGQGFIIEDDCGNFHGDGSEIDAGASTIVYPIPIEDGTFDPMMTFPQDDTNVENMIGFDFEQSFLDASMATIRQGYDTGGSEFIPSSTKGLVDLYAEIYASPAPSTAGFTVRITSEFSSVSGYPMKGLLATHFGLFNDTQSTTPVIASFTPDPLDPEVYEVTFDAAQTSGDTIYLTAPTPATAGYGFGYSFLINSPIVIP